MHSRVPNTSAPGVADVPTSLPWHWRRPCELHAVVCYTEKARKAWHRKKRQKQWHNQNHAAMRGGLLDDTLTTCGPHLLVLLDIWSYQSPNKTWLVLSLYVHVLLHLRMRGHLKGEGGGPGAGWEGVYKPS